MSYSHTLVAAVLALASGTAALAQQGDGTFAQVQANVVKPAKVPVTAERVAGIAAPPGFTVSLLANGLKNPRMLAVTPTGDIYVSRRDQGDVLLLRDANGDGTLDTPFLIVANRPGIHGLAVHERKLYMATVKEVYVSDIHADGLLGPARLLIDDLPDGGQHPNRTMVFGPDGWMYLSIGSTCNACNETNPEAATVLRVSPDGKQRSIFASGLRNTIGFGFHPATGELWGMDHGSDFLGDDIPPEELNRIERGKRYGWPHVWGVDGLDPQTTPPGGITKETWRAMSTPMVLGYTAHAAPMQMAYYTGETFPAEYRNDAFVAMRGSWNRAPAAGYEVVRIRFDANGQPIDIVPFVTGFLTRQGQEHFARPVGLAAMPDGSLILTDDANGAIYRIAYTGTAQVPAGPARAQPASPPADRLAAQLRQGTNVPLAIARAGMAQGAAMQVVSRDFGEGTAMPDRLSAYHEDVSPELAWSPVAGARSYVIVMEDPDARRDPPIVHWVAYNIPADTTRLPEGLPVQERLTLPEGMLQGPGTRGLPGYAGPRPPAGDAPHRYVFQVFALDTMLSLPPGASRDEVLAAAQGHVIGHGTLTGRYQRPGPALP